MSCVNALSEVLQLEIWRERLHLGAGIRQGRSQGAAGEDRQGRASKTGTKITFKPDSSIMDATKFNFDTLAQRLRELAFLNKGLKITLTDEREEPARVARIPLQRRHRRVHQAPEQGQERAARQADLLRRRARTAERRCSPWKWRCSTTIPIAKSCSASPTTSTPSTAART